MDVLKEVGKGKGKGREVEEEEDGMEEDGTGGRGGGREKGNRDRLFVRRKCRLDTKRRKTKRVCAKHSPDSRNGKID